MTCHYRLVSYFDCGNLIVSVMLLLDLFHFACAALIMYERSESPRAKLAGPVVPCVYSTLFVAFTDFFRKPFTLFCFVAAKEHFFIFYFFVAGAMGPHRFPVS